MNREQLQTMLDPIMQEIQKVKDLIASAERGKLDAEVELTTLKEDLPELLANCFVGKTRRTEVIKVKKRIAELEETIADCPSIVKILERDIIRLGHRASKILSRYERPLSAYEQQKKQILEKPDSRLFDKWTEELLLMSKNPDLDCEADAQKFLADLKG